MTDEKTNGKRSDIEKGALKSYESVKEFLDRYERVFVAATLIYGAAWALGLVDPAVPWWWPLPLIGILAAVAAAHVFADKILDLFPDKAGIYVVELNATEDAGGRVIEYTEDEWERTQVRGSLYQWDNSQERVYEARKVIENEDAPDVIVANWRGTKPASDFLAAKTVDQVYQSIDELRSHLEPEAAEARKLKQQIRGIIRVMDKRRAEEQAAALDAATVDQSVENATITEVLAEVLDDDLHPEKAVQNAEEAAETGSNPGGDGEENGGNSDENTDSSNTSDDAAPAPTNPPAAE